MSNNIFAIVVCCTAVLFTGCRKSAPGLEQNGGPSSRTVSIEYLKSFYSSAPVTINEDIRIEGRVVSSDRYGNFYKTLVVEDATGGIVVRLDNEQLFKTFLYGCEVSVSCNSLILGTYGGALQLGGESYDPQ